MRCASICPPLTSDGGACCCCCRGSYRELANAQGYSVFEDFVGHGIGRIFHEPPVVQHTSTCGCVAGCVCACQLAERPRCTQETKEVRRCSLAWCSRSVRGSLCVPGCVVCARVGLRCRWCVRAAEPILTRGSTEWAMWDDGWTVVSLDGERSAQFEHTVLITDDGAEILTRVK